MTIGTPPVSAATAARAYGAVQLGDTGSGDTGSSDTGAATAAGSFGSVLSRAVQEVVDVSHHAEAQSIQAIGGNGNLTEVVTAVSKAELTLQSAAAIRDRVVQAYQDIMHMAI